MKVKYSKEVADFIKGCSAMSNIYSGAKMYFSPLVYIHEEGDPEDVFTMKLYSELYPEQKKIFLQALRVKPLAAAVQP
jgi:hypothetical protein